MEMKRCPNGHFYDQSKTPNCPYCMGASANANVTVPLNAGGIGATMPLQPPVPGPAPSPAGFSSEPDDGKTVAVIKHKIGLDPVVGWLVCVDGKDKGRDYRIHADNNYIGRSERMDICIRGDDTVSRENHAVISYDMRDKIFYFSPGDGRSIVRLNDKALFTTVELKKGDVVEIGSSKLMFVPLCGKEFDWE